MVTLCDFLCHAEAVIPAVLTAKETGQTTKAIGRDHEKLSFGQHVVHHKLSKIERFFTRAAQISKSH